MWNLVLVAEYSLSEVRRWPALAKLPRFGTVLRPHIVGVERKEMQRAVLILDIKWEALSEYHRWRILALELVSTISHWQRGPSTCCAAASLGNAHRIGGDKNALLCTKLTLWKSMKNDNWEPSLNTPFAVKNNYGYNTNSFACVLKQIYFVRWREHPLNVTTAFDYCVVHGSEWRTECDWLNRRLRSLVLSWEPLTEHVQLF